jgi:hypothetical protein
MLSAAIEMLGAGSWVKKCHLRRRSPQLWVPFGLAQGRLSTSFGWRLTSLRKTGISWLTRFLLATGESVYGEVLATLRVDARSAFGADPGSLAASLRKSSAI